jgi:hypothetical protein
MNRAAATALIAVACLAVPAAASASVTSTNMNRRADRAALSAYATYLQSLVAGKSSGVEAETLFASATTDTCYKALEPIATSQTVPAGTSNALMSIGDEIGADARLEFFASATTPMSQLATTLTALHWGTAASAATVKRFLTAGEALMAVEPSNLCGDANSVASEAGAQQVTVPPATQIFLQSYTSDSSLANTRLSAFVKLLNSYATSSDRAVAEKIDLLAVKVNNINTLAITAATKSLFHALGIPAAQAAAAAAASAA